MEPGLSSLLINQNGDCLAGSTRSVRIVGVCDNIYFKIEAGLANFGTKIK